MPHTFLMDFEEVVNKYSRRIYKMAYWMVGNEADAQDITQDVFYNAYRRIKFFRGESEIFTYLYRIALNQIYRFRKRSHRFFSIENMDDIGDKKFPMEKRLDMRDAVFSLPPKLKEVTILYYFEGVNYKGIQRILKIPEGTVKSRLARAKDLLKIRLGVNNE